MALELARPLAARQAAAQGNRLHPNSGLGGCAALPRGLTRARASARWPARSARPHGWSGPRWLSSAHWPWAPARPRSRAWRPPSSRSWPRGAGRTSPARPTSPKAMKPRGSGRPRSELWIASITARSAAGSLMRTPPTALTNTSWSKQAMPAWRCSTASSIASRSLLQPHAEPPRAGDGRAVHQGLHLDEQRARALQRDQHAGARHRLAMGREEDRARVGHALQAALGHREHADLVDRAEAVLEGAHEPEAELCVSPSKYSTVSTMCSSTRGPASEPSLVTWPTSTMAVPVALAVRVSCAAHSRTCATEPGAELS